MNDPNVVDTAMHFDELLHKLYARAADMAPNESVREVFRELRERETAKRNTKMRAAASIEDI